MDLVSHEMLRFHDLPPKQDLYSVASKSEPTSTPDPRGHFKYDESPAMPELYQTVVYLRSINGDPVYLVPLSEISTKEHLLTTLTNIFGPHPSPPTIDIVGKRLLRIHYSVYDTCVPLLGGHELLIHWDDPLSHSHPHPLAHPHTHSHTHSLTVTFATAPNVAVSAHISAQVPREPAAVAAFLRPVYAEAAMSVAVQELQLERGLEEVRVRAGEELQRLFTGAAMRDGRRASPYAGIKVDMADVRFLWKGSGEEVRGVEEMRRRADMWRGGMVCEIMALSDVRMG